MGSKHWQVDTMIRGVRYMQGPLGNPRERLQPMRGLKIHPTATSVDWFESPPLALVWSCEGSY